MYEMWIQFVFIGWHKNQRHTLTNLGCPSTEHAVYERKKYHDENERLYLLGEKYIEAVRDMSNSENSKLVVLPADIPAAVRGIMNNTK